MESELSGDLLCLVSRSESLFAEPAKYGFIMCVHPFILVKI
jgi:hypothetical protein